MSQDLSEARERLADAQRQKEEADDLIRALEQQVVDGHDEVVVLEAGEQYGLQRLAELQQLRAQKQLQRAEAEEKERTLGQAREEAADELGAVCDEVLAGKYAAALAALVDFAAACRAREEAVRQHAKRLRDLGDDRMYVETHDSRRILDVAGQRFESGRCAPQDMAMRVVGAVAAALSMRAPAGRSREAIAHPSNLHPVERLLAVVGGEDATAMEVNWGSTQFASRMAVHARTVAEEGI